MNIAAMRVRVTFQKNTVIVDKYGNHKTGWADYFSCWATVGTSSGSESSGVVINPEESLDFTCRYCSELADVESTKYRIIAEGRTYNITYVNPMPASVLRNARRLFLFSSAQKGSSSPVETGGGYVMTDEITNVQSGYFTQERIQGDLDYRRAQTIAKKMLDDGLISVAEFNKLTAINRETFSPLFAEIMPKIP